MRENFGLRLDSIGAFFFAGTSARVGAHHAANTIGMQIAAAGFGGAVVPSLAGVLAQNFSLEAIPVYLVGVFILLTMLYLVTSRPRRTAL
jgi:fucose permease